MAELQSVNQYMVAPCNQNFLMRKDELVRIAFMQLIMLLLFTNRKAAVGTSIGIKGTMVEPENTFITHVR